MASNVPVLSIVYCPGCDNETTVSLIDFQPLSPTQTNINATIVCPYCQTPVEIDTEFDINDHF